MTTKELDDLATAVVSEIKASLDPRDAQVHALAARVVELEHRVGGLAQKPCVKFTGIWTTDRSYGPGDAATRSGALWICRKTTIGEFDHMAWVLAVKRGAS